MKKATPAAAAVVEGDDELDEDERELRQLEADMAM